MKGKWRRFSFAAVVCAAALFPSPAPAQLAASIRLNQYDYLQYEPVMVEVNITNRSARPVRLEDKDDKPWLRLMVTHPGGEMVAAAADLRMEPVTIPGGQTVFRRFNLVRFFHVGAVGRYEVRAKVTTPGGTEVNCAPRKFFVSSGVALWQETVGILVARPNAQPPADNAERKPGPYTFVRNQAAKKPDPAGDNAEEQSRTYSLLQFTQGGNNLLYLRVEDKSREVIYGVFQLGAYLPFLKPQARVDKNKNLHVLFQTGSRLFTYVRVDPNAQVTDNYDLTNYLSAPKLTATEDGRVIVNGGERKDAG